MKETRGSKGRKELRTLACAVAVLGMAACAPMSSNAPVETDILAQTGVSVNSEAYRQGAADAKTDFAAGFYRLETYGRPPLDEQGWKADMKRRYGIHIVTVAGCGAAQDIRDHAEGYNETMIRLLKEKRGIDLPF